MEETLLPPPLPSYWQGIVEGGPLIMALHLCMLVCFAVSILLAVRRASTTAALALSFAPFCFGAAALWLGTVVLVLSMNSSMEARDWPAMIHVFQRPFYVGFGLSAVAFISHFLFRALNSKSRVVNRSRLVLT